MKFELNRFKKIKEDDRSAVLQHPAGHKITIAKHVLSPDLKNQLSKLPMHFDEGGDVPDSSDNNNDGNSSSPPPVNININANPQPQPQAQGAPNPIVDMPAYDPQASKMALLQNPTVGDSVKEKIAKDQGLQLTADQINQALPQGAARQPVSVPAPVTPNPPGMMSQGSAPQMSATPEDPYGMQAYSDAMTKGYGEQRAGIQNYAQAEGQLGKTQANLLNNQVQQQQAQMSAYQSHYQDLDQERQSFMQDIQNQHIDPKHYLNSMGTGQKISTAIGLILGGMGGGMTHQGNPALDFLNNQISRDIDAQKANLGKSENLLNANLRQFGNLRDATDMTRIMQTDIVRNQLSEAAAQSADPLAKARAQMAIGQLDNQSAGFMQQMAMRKTMMNQMQSGGGGGMDPAQKIRMMGIMGQISPAQQESALKELGTTQEMAKARDNALGVFEQLNKLNTVGSRLTSPLQTSKQVGALRDNAAVMLAKDEAGRVNEFEFEAAKNLFPAPGDSAETVQHKRNDLNAFVQKKLNTPHLSSLGINAIPPSRYDGSGQSKIQLGPIAK